MPRSRKLFLCGFTAVLLLPFLSCGSAHESNEYYVFVAASLQVPLLAGCRRWLFQSGGRMEGSQ
jgi:hypothetical protein